MHLHKNSHLRAFTIIEIIIVVVIISVIAAFALPAYNKSVDRALERKGIIMMRAMDGLHETWRVKHGEFPIDTSCWETEDINEKFKLNIVEEGFNLYCCPTHQVALGYECGIHFDNSTVGMHIHAGKDPHCLGGSYDCPTLPKIPPGHDDPF